VQHVSYLPAHAQKHVHINKAAKLQGFKVSLTYSFHLLRYYLFPSCSLLQYELHSCLVSISPWFLFYIGHSWAAAFAAKKPQAAKSTALKMPIIIIATWHSSVVPRILLLLSLPSIPPPLFYFYPCGQHCLQSRIPV